MTRSDSILEPRPGEQGESLRSAYRPRSTDQLAQMLMNHLCRACNRTGHTQAEHWDTSADYQKIGSLFYSTVEHRCSCGLSTKLFVILNELLREAGHNCVPAQVALDQIDTHLPPAQLDLGLIQTRCLLHRGDDAEAVILAESLAKRYPDQPECHFNAGTARHRMGDVAQALEHYQRSLALHPHLGEAWLNRGLLLRHLGRLREARFCFMRVRQAGGEQVHHEPSPKLLHEISGTFGVLRVIEDEDLRGLFIGSQCQGAMHRAVDDGGPEPGPFAVSQFTMGWLLAGCRYPQGRGLMLGLGSGAGAMTLLANFPTLRLKVVEIDPQIIEIALRFFPRLARLQRQRRLEIVQADARDVVGAGSSYDFVLLDVFTGVPEPAPLLEEPSFLSSVVASAPLVLANAIFTLGSETQAKWLELFAQAGRPIVRLYPTSAPERWARHPHNWILSTMWSEEARSFVPFADSSHFMAQAARNDFRNMCARALPVPPSPMECTAPVRA
ncbi:MAG: tetratricopeptide repeat protein [Myxococcota bacterium]